MNWVKFHVFTHLTAVYFLKLKEVKVKKKQHFIYTFLDHKAIHNKNATALKQKVTWKFNILKSWLFN